MPHGFQIVIVTFVMTHLFPALLFSQTVNYEESPIFYSTREPDNAIESLKKGLEAGTLELKTEEPQGFLKSLLEQLKVEISSQVLVFSKTSLQSHHITPETPRAIYFNDHVHVGYVQDGLIEIAATDKNLGMVFYTMDQTEERPLPIRKSNNCLNCHGSSRTHGVPGVLVRSVFPDQKGQPVISAGSFRTDHTSPFSQRWGGWYVLGTHGEQIHMGNHRLKEPKKPKEFNNAAGQNLTTLPEIVSSKDYLLPYSDLVALMVLEHQTDILNHFTILNFEAQVLGQPTESSGTSEVEKQQRLNKTVDRLLQKLLFHQETQLISEVRGVSTFRGDFELLGKKDSKGRSLRDMDLTRRMFRFPCSYLIYSPAFASLPDRARQLVLQRMREVLTSPEVANEYRHLTDEDRSAIHEILSETLPEYAVL